MRIYAVVTNVDYMKVREGYKALNLSLPKELVKLMKIHCIETETDVSSLTESLYTSFLKQQEQPIMIPIKKGAAYPAVRPKGRVRQGKTSQGDRKRNEG